MIGGRLVPPPEAGQKSEGRQRCSSCTEAPPCFSHSCQSCSHSWTPEQENKIKMLKIFPTNNDSMWTPGSRRERLRQPLQRR